MAQTNSSTIPIQLVLVHLLVHVNLIDDVRVMLNAYSSKFIIAQLSYVTQSRSIWGKVKNAIYIYIYINKITPSDAPPYKPGSGCIRINLCEWNIYFRNTLQWVRKEHVEFIKLNSEMDMTQLYKLGYTPGEFYHH